VAEARTAGGSIDWTGYALLWVRMAFGAHSLISGLNNFVPLFALSSGDPALSPIGPFMGELIHIGLYDVVKVIETVVGICLLTNRFVPLAAAIELPISFVIAYLCIVVDGSPNIMFSGFREIGFNLFILACYADYFLPIVAWKAKVRPLWHAAGPEGAAR
jgi:uncharacterized membrane protein YphA (DoxX/SURF4 family)